MSNLIPIKLAEQAMAVRDEEIARLKGENAFLKMEVERLKNNCEYLDKKLDEELGEDDDGGDSYNHPHAFGQ